MAIRSACPWRTLLALSIASLPWWTPVSAQGESRPQILAQATTADPSASGGAASDDTQQNTRTPLGGLPTTRDSLGATRFGNTSTSDFGSGTGLSTTNPSGLGTGAFPNGTPPSSAVGTRPFGGRSPNGLDPRGAYFPSVPKDTGTLRPNSGYGLPNGSRPTHMDARGIQRID